MNRWGLFIATVLLASPLAFSQTTSPASAPKSDAAADGQSSTVKGCLDGDRGNYIVVENKTGMVYVLKGVGNKLDSQLGHEVEVKGRMLPGTIKTGVRTEKAGSNPSDTVHGVDGVPLEIADWRTDVRTTAKHCKAADKQ